MGRLIWSLEIMEGNPGIIFPLGKQDNLGGLVGLTLIISCLFPGLYFQWDWYDMTFDSS